MRGLIIVSMIRKASDTVSPIAASTAAASSLMCSSIRARTTAFAGIVWSSKFMGYIVAQIRLECMRLVVGEVSDSSIDQTLGNTTPNGRNWPKLSFA